MSTTFLIVGATGKQGGKAISTLLSNNDPSQSIRFTTRNPESKSSLALIEKGAKAYKADLLDKSSLKDALTGVDRAFLVTDAMAGEKEVEQGTGFIDVAKECGVKHVVFTSVCAADTATMVPHFQTKDKIERHLKAAGMSYTILRPVAFMDNFPKQAGVFRFMAVGLFFSMAGSKPQQFIAVEDIGIVAGKALSSPDDSTFKNTTIDLSAGEYSLEDVRAAYTKAQGREPWFAYYAPKMVRNLLPYDFKQMMIYFDQHGYPKTNIDELRRIHPGLLSFQRWIESE